MEVGWDRRRDGDGQRHRSCWRLHPTNLTNANGTLYFDANDGTHGEELWKSDGTAAGTVAVANIDASDLTNVNGMLYFVSFDSTGAGKLWKSDGTAAGTVILTDLAAGSGSRLI